jgi:hypothetical protein
MNKRDSSISAMLDWCVDTLDKLHALQPSTARDDGLRLVQSWKRRLETAIDERSEHDAHTIISR